MLDLCSFFEANDTFREYKEVLKERFEQIDIWISSREIQSL